MTQAFDLLFEIDQSQHALSHCNDFHLKIISLTIVRCDLPYFLLLHLKLRQKEDEYHSLRKNIKFSHSNPSVLSNTVVRTVRVQFHAIQFTFMKADIRTFEIGIRA